MSKKLPRSPWRLFSVKVILLGPQFDDPGGVIVLEMEGGMRAIIAQIEDGAGPFSFELVLSKARVRADESMNEVEVITRSQAVRKGPDRPAKFTRVVNPEGARLNRDLRVEIRRLLENLISDEPLRATMQDGRVALECLVAAHVSDGSGHLPVGLPLVEKRHRDLWLPIT